VLLAAPAVASSVSALSAAQAWLQSHKSPTEDQLGELQKANPAAFALVNSLLSKHAKHAASLAPDEMGPDVFRRMMTPRHLAAAAPHADYGESMSLGMSQPAVVDQAHYDPGAAADKDESMVDKLLGAVAGLAGDRGKKIALLRQKRRHNKHQVEDAFAKDRDLFGMDDEPAKPAKPVQATEVPQVRQETVVEAPKKHENSYLKDIDLSGDMPKALRANHQAPKEVSEGADLASFSFDESAPAATVAPKPVAPKKKKDNAFLKWLGIVKKAPAPQEQPAAPAQKAPKQNSYLADFMA
jgi:hypothetical protein